MGQIEGSDQEEEAVRAATLRFYEALDDIVTGRGVAKMEAAWHHTARVTASHPLGEWTHGWDEILASWQAVAAVGSESGRGASLRDLRVHLYGDVAYTTSVFLAPPRFGAPPLNCTNILHKVDGVWKMVHHHADKAPAIEAGLNKMAEEG